MEEIIKHIDMEMLKSYSYQGSYTDEYLFFTDKLENIFQENINEVMPIRDNQRQPADK